MLQTAGHELSLTVGPTESRGRLCVVDPREPVFYPLGKDQGQGAVQNGSRLIGQGKGPCCQCRGCCCGGCGWEGEISTEFPRPSGQPPTTSVSSQPAGWFRLVVIVLVGFPSNEQENLARQVFIPKPFSACTDP